MDVEKEYKRIKELFKGCDETQLKLVDGLIRECARMKVELDKLCEIVKKTGRVKINPKNPSMQRELPVAKNLDRVRACYLNHISKLSNILGKNILDDEDDGLSEFE